MRHLPAFCACALFLAAWAYAFSSPPAQPTFTLLGVTESGDLYGLDTGLTSDDCAAAMRASVPGVFLACEQER